MRKSGRNAAQPTMAVHRKTSDCVSYGSGRQAIPDAVSTCMGKPLMNTHEAMKREPAYTAPARRSTCFSDGCMYTRCPCEQRST